MTSFCAHTCSGASAFRADCRNQVEGDPETVRSWKMGDGRTLAGRASLNAEGGDVVADAGYHLFAEWVL